MLEYLRRVNRPSIQVTTIASVAKPKEAHPDNEKVLKAAGRNIQWSIKK